MIKLSGPDTFFNPLINGSNAMGAEVNLMLFRDNDLSIEAFHAVSEGNFGWTFCKSYDKIIDFNGPGRLDHPGQDKTGIAFDNLDNPGQR
tara:strand:- start:5094 stop:5363 length:270 start_codon:yes stop_codon:yes gene_type:complete